MVDGEKNLIDQAIKQSMMGEASAFGLLYDRFQPQIYRFIYLKVSHREEAEDLTHQVFLSAWQNISNYEHLGFPFSSWLYSIARNKVIDHYRAQKTNLNIESLEIIDNSENPHEKIDKHFNIKNIEKALKKLNSIDQDIILMRYVNELSVRETAKILNKSEISIRLLQHRAIKKLQKLLN